jgi:hypothetical protein
MAYIITKHGRQYWQESRRVPGGKTPKTFHLGPVGGNTRKAADEKYRDVLRNNVYVYGKSRAGGRYAAEARAREEYHRSQFKSADAPLTQEEHHRQQVKEFWLKVDATPSSNFEVRNRHYTVSHGSASHRAQEHLAGLREAAGKEATAPPAHTEKNFTVDDAIEAREATFEAAVDEYNAGTEAAPDSPTPDDAPPSVE